MKTKVLVVGSIAFDIIFSIPHDFRDSVPVEHGEIRNFNAVFLANKKLEFPGGTAGNIGFWMGIDEAPPVIFCPVGKDFEEKHYKQKLEHLGVQVRGQIADYSAHAYMVSDPLHQQLIIWQPNDYTLNEQSSLLEYFTKEELSSFTHVIFAAGTSTSTINHMREFREINTEAFTIFDPGQSTILYEIETFQKCCKYTNMLIGNDIEFTYFRKYDFPKTLHLIETLGERGVVYSYQELEARYEAEPVESIVETTGAGDAFRAGLLSALSRGETMDEAIKNGIRLGAKCVTLPSAQY